MTCPHPDKVAYLSERAAKRAMRSIKTWQRDGGGFLHVYRCGGHWHLGHGAKTWRTEAGRKFR